MAVLCVAPLFGSYPMSVLFRYCFIGSYLRVAHMDTAAVLPQYRGHQLQYRLMQAAEADLRALGFRYLMGTIHPDNIYSMNNGLKQGYRIIGEKIKHGGKRRAILMKELV